MTTDTAVLELETSMAGKHVNGVDIIAVNPNGRTRPRLIGSSEVASRQRGVPSTR
jgi:hypothetical protein